MSTELTVKNLVAAIISIEDNQVIINQACAAAFTGRNVKAPKESCLHKALLELIKLRDKFNAVHKAANDIVRENAKLNDMKPTGMAKYNGLNILSTEITRWVNRVSQCAKYKGRRASIKATGGAKQISIALVQSMKVKASSSSSSESAKEIAEKAIGTLDCNQSLKYLVDSYSFEVVSGALAKLK